MAARWPAHQDELLVSSSFMTIRCKHQSYFQQKNSSTGTGQIIMGRQLSVCLKIFWSLRIWQHIHKTARSKRKFNHSYLKTTVELFVLLLGLFQQHHRVSQFPGYHYSLFTHTIKDVEVEKYCMNLYYFSPKRLTESIFYFYFFCFCKHLWKVLTIN